MAPVGVAIIGSGIFVKEQHLPAALASPLISLKAIWSRSLKSAEEAAKLASEAGTTVDVYSSESGPEKSYDELLKRSDIDGIILALPIVDQLGYIQKALTAGKHVLAEKPVAKDVETAVNLIKFYKKVSAETKATLAIAENFRFLKGFVAGAEEIKKLGRVTGFFVRVNSMIEKSNKYYNTSWRTKPDYPGGFLLDGGVHFTAGMRKLLGPEHPITSLTAMTSLVTNHLPPKDTINAVLKTEDGIVGTYIHSAGTTMDAFDFQVACENGHVQASPTKVVTVHGYGAEAKSEEKKYEKSSGVKEEVHAWAEGIVAGTPNPEQCPEQALADLELVEKMLISGDEDGEKQTLQYQ